MATKEQRVCEILKTARNPSGIGHAEVQELGGLGVKAIHFDTERKKFQIEWR